MKKIKETKRPEFHFQFQLDYPENVLNRLIFSRYLVACFHVKGLKSENSSYRKMNSDPLRS